MAWRGDWQMNRGVDDYTRAFGVKLATTTSRRGFIARVGKVALILAAGSVAEPLLPVDRTVQYVSASPSCSDGTNCGMHGYPCDCCGGSASSCPSGTSTGSSWYACCFVAGCELISYTDCCYPGAYCCSTPAAPNGQPDCCPGCNFCTNSAAGNWCSGSNNCYKCTLSLSAGGCSPC